MFRTVGPTIMPATERLAKLVSGGRAPISGAIVPSLVLHTIGARTGEPRRAELMYCPDGEDMLVTGSNFAREHHPAWSANLIANPHAVVELHGERIDVDAFLIPDEDREATWAILEDNWPGYRGYERTARRELRIFRLVPRRH